MSGIVKDEGKIGLLERVAGRLPVKKIIFEKSKFRRHDVYMAYGRGDGDIWYAIWGLRVGTQTVARSAIFGNALTRDQVRQALFDDAVWFHKEADKRHMTDEGWWTSGRVE
jgi:hypothetical protein